MVCFCNLIDIRTPNFKIFFSSLIQSELLKLAISFLRSVSFWQFLLKFKQTKYDSYDNCYRPIVDYETSIFSVAEKLQQFLTAVTNKGKHFNISKDKLSILILPTVIYSATSVKTWLTIDIQLKEYQM